MPALNISVPPLMKSWVEAQVENGNYGTSSDYIRSLIRRDKERLEAIEHLQRALDIGMDSGAPQVFNFKEFKARMRNGG